MLSKAKKEDFYWRALPPSTYKKLQQIAARENISLPKAVEQTLAKALEAEVPEKRDADPTGSLYKSVYDFQISKGAKPDFAQRAASIANSNSTPKK